MKEIFLILRYFTAGEESRPGRTDYWNSVFLLERTPFNRFCLEFSKVLFIISMIMSIMIAISQL